MAKKREPWVFCSDAAEMIGCSHRTVERLADDGELKSWRLTPNGWRHITVDSIERYLKRSRNGGGKK